MRRSTEKIFRFNHSVLRHYVELLDAEPENQLIQFTTLELLQFNLRFTSEFLILQSNLQNKEIVLDVLYHVKAFLSFFQEMESLSFVFKDTIQSRLISLIVRLCVLSNLNGLGMESVALRSLDHILRVVTSPASMMKCYIYSQLVAGNENLNQSNFLFHSQSYAKKKMLQIFDLDLVHRIDSDPQSVTEFFFMTMVLSVPSQSFELHIICQRILHFLSVNYAHFQRTRVDPRMWFLSIQILGKRKLHDLEGWKSDYHQNPSLLGFIPDVIDSFDQSILDISNFHFRMSLFKNLVSFLSYNINCIDKRCIRNVEKIYFQLKELSYAYNAKVTNFKSPSNLQLITTEMILIGLILQCGPGVFPTRLLQDLINSLGAREEFAAMLKKMEFLTLYFSNIMEHLMIYVEFEMTAADRELQAVKMALIKFFYSVLQKNFVHLTFKNRATIMRYIVWSNKYFDMLGQLKKIRIFIEKDMSDFTPKIILCYWVERIRNFNMDKSYLEFIKSLKMVTKILRTGNALKASSPVIFRRMINNEQMIIENYSFFFVRHFISFTNLCMYTLIKSQFVSFVKSTISNGMHLIENITLANTSDLEIDLFCQACLQYRVLSIKDPRVEAFTARIVDQLKTIGFFDDSPTLDRINLSPVTESQSVSDYFDVTAEDKSRIALKKTTHRFERDYSGIYHRLNLTKDFSYGQSSLHLIDKFYYEPEKQFLSDKQGFVRDHLADQPQPGFPEMADPATASQPQIDFLIQDVLLEKMKLSHFSKKEMNEFGFLATNNENQLRHMFKIFNLWMASPELGISQKAILLKYAQRIFDEDLLVEFELVVEEVLKGINRDVLNLDAAGVDAVVSFLVNFTWGKVRSRLNCVLVFNLTEILLSMSPRSVSVFQKLALLRGLLLLHPDWDIVEGFLWSFHETFRQTLPGLADPVMSEKLLIDYENLLLYVSFLYEESEISQRVQPIIQHIKQKRQHLWHFANHKIETNINDSMMRMVVKVAYLELMRIYSLAHDSEDPKQHLKINQEINGFSASIVIEDRVVIDILPIYDYNSTTNSLNELSYKCAVFSQLGYDYYPVLSLNIYLINKSKL